MNSSLLRRLFTAVSEHSSEATLKVCRKVIAAEREKGHGKLAADLESILDRSKKPVLREMPTKPGRSRTAPLVQEISHERLRHHMVLPVDTETSLLRIEREFAARERLRKHGLQPRRRILLHGPPGCGKTLGAERLAWNCGLPLRRVRFETLLSSYFGETASNLHRVFKEAATSPCALFLDECDTIARSRENRNDVGEVPRIVNTLLLLLEEYDGDGLVIAATNLTANLDRALFRRFDEVVEIPLPQTEEIERLLRMSLEAMKTAKGIDWFHLARSLDGHSCSDVVRVAENAAKHCILEGRKVVSEEDLGCAMNELNLMPLHTHARE